MGLAGGSTQGTLPLDGIDQWQAIVGGAKTSRKEVIYGHESGAVNFGLRSGQWKILRCFSGAPCASAGDNPSGYTAPGYGLTAPAPPPLPPPRLAVGQCNVTAGLCCPGGHGPITMGSNPDACCAQCQATATCSLWTFNNSTGEAKCFIKLQDVRTSCPADPEKAAFCTTGTFGRAPITPGPAPPPPPSPPDPEGNPYVLFDLVADPYEHTDVSAANPDGALPSVFLWLAGCHWLAGHLCPHPPACAHFFVTLWLRLLLSLPRHVLVAPQWLRCFSRA